MRTACQHLARPPKLTPDPLRSEGVVLKAGQYAGRQGRRPRPASNNEGASALGATSRSLCCTRAIYYRRAGKCSRSALVKPRPGEWTVLGCRRCNRHFLSAALTYVPISHCIQCNFLHSYIAPDASSSNSTASSGATLIKDYRRFHAAQPPLLAWPALLSLSKYPDSARRSVPALWLAGTVALQGSGRPGAAERAVVQWPRC